MSESDPIQTLILKLALTVISAFGIVFFLKPLITFAAPLFVCGSCDPSVMVILTVVMFSLAIMVPIYKTIGVFFQ